MVRDGEDQHRLQMMNLCMYGNMYGNNSHSPTNDVLLLHVWELGTMNNESCMGIMNAKSQTKQRQSQTKLSELY